MNTSNFESAQVKTYKNHLGVIMSDYDENRSENNYTYAHISKSIDIYIENGYVDMPEILWEDSKFHDRQIVRALYKRYPATFSEYPTLDCFVFITLTGWEK